MSVDLAGMLLRAMNLDVCVKAIVVACLFVAAKVLYWEDTSDRGRRFSAANIDIFLAVGLFAGNLAEQFYLEGADVWGSLAHPIVRFTYLALLIRGFSRHIANVLCGNVVRCDRIGWRRVLAVVLAADLALIGFFMLLEHLGLWGPIR